MASGQSILGSHLLDLLLPTANSNVGGEIASIGNEGSNSFMRFYDLDRPSSNGYLVGMSNQDFMIMKQIGNTEVGIGTSRVRTTGATLEVAGTISTSNITTYNSDSNVYFGGKSVAGIQNINFAGQLLQGGEPFKTSQWTTTGSNIYITGSNVGIGTMSPSNALHVVGDAYFSGTVYAFDVVDGTGMTSTFKSATIYNGAGNGTKTLYTNATTPADRILFSINLLPGRYLINASIPFYNLSGTAPIDSVNWAQLAIYKATPASFTNTTSPIYVSPISSIGVSATELESAPFNMTLIVNDVNGADFVLAVTGKGHQLQFGNVANVPELKLYAVPLRGLGVEDPISTRQAIQINAVRQMYTATASQTMFTLPSIEGFFSADNSNADVYVNGTKLRHTEQYGVAAAFNSLSNITVFSVATTTGVADGAKVDISVWPYAVATDYYKSGYLYQNITNISTPWLNVAGGGVRTTDRAIIDGDLYVKGNIYGGCNTTQFAAGVQWDSVSAISCNVIGTLNIMDGAVTPAKLDFSTGNVGIGTTNPQAPLHVVGTTLVQGDILPTSCNVYDIGSANYRFKDLYLSGSTINLDGLLISKDATTGGLSVKGSDDAPLDTSTRNLYATGNIGIGTTMALARTHIYHTSTGNILRVDDANAPDATPFIINQDGNVGVGTTNSLAKLHVGGGINFSGPTTVSSQGGHLIWNRVSGSGMIHILNQKGSGDGGIGFGEITATNVMTETVRISAAGNVGIGTTDPTDKLRVHDGAIRAEWDTATGVSRVMLALFNNNTGTYSSAHETMIELGGKISSSHANWASTRLVNIPQNVNGTGDFAIETREAAVHNERLRIKANGNVGVGTTDPLDKLHVQGNIRASGTVTASNLTITGDFVTLNTFTSNTEQMVIMNAGTGPALKVTQTGINSVAEFYDDETGIALMISNSGYIGIGTTTPAFKLQVDDETNNILQLNEYTDTDGAVIRARRARGTKAAPTAVLVDNVITGLRGFGWNGTGFSGAAGYMDICAAETFASGSNGSYIKFITTPTLSINNAERMRIASDGNVGIGTTNPLAKLHVYGTANTGSTTMTESTITLGSGRTTNGATVMRFVSDSNIYTAGGLTLTRATGANGDSVITHRGLGGLYIATSEAAPIYLQNNTSGSASTVSILSNGNVGINTTNPQQKLQVVGTVQATAFTGDGASITNVSQLLARRVFQQATFGGYGAATTNRRYALISTVATNNGIGRIVGWIGGHDNSVVQQGKLTYDIVIDTRGANVPIVKGLASIDGAPSMHGIAIYRNTSTGVMLAYLTGGEYTRFYLDAYNIDGAPIETSISWSADTAFTPPSGFTLFWDSVSHVPSNSTSYDVYCTTASTPVQGITVRNSGNVGISSTIPQAKLDVNGTTFTTSLLTCAGITNSTARPAVGTGQIAGEIRALGSADGTTALGYADDGFLRISAGGGSSAAQKSFIDISGYSTLERHQTITFGTAGTERMRVLSSGNIGIGTTNPTSQLHVHAANQCTQHYGTGAVHQINVQYFADVGGATYWKIASGIPNIPSGWGYLLAIEGDISRVNQARYIRHFYFNTTGQVDVFKVNGHLDTDGGSAGAHSTIQVWRNTSNNTVDIYVVIDSFSFVNITIRVANQTLPYLAKTVTAVAAPSATANYVLYYDLHSHAAITTTYAITAATSGFVGIGTTNPFSKLHVNGDITLGLNTYIKTTGGSLCFQKTVFSVAEQNTGVLMDLNGRTIFTQSGQEAARFCRNDSDGKVIMFCRGVNLTSFAEVGSIQVTTTGSSFVNTSDYRTKNVLSPITDASIELLRLNPINFTFKQYPEIIHQGFLAHELQEVVPAAVFGEKDAMNADGSPDLQAIDQTKLIPLLTAALQDALQSIARLQSEITDLKAFVNMG